MADPILVITLPLPLPELIVNGQVVETRVFDGDFSVFDQAQVVCSTVLNTLDADFIARLPDTIKLISNIGVGYDNIDLAAASAAGIAVTNTPVVTEDTADLTFLLILAATRQLTANEAFLRAGQWTEAQPLGTLGKTVHGSKLGIIGFGEIGQAVARRAKAFSMDILYHGPRPKPDADSALGATYFDKLEDMLAEADIVSINCPLTDDTHHIMNAESIAAMKSDAVLVNTGRGPLVDEEALVKALRTGHLFAAGLDVFEREPEVHSGLLELENVTLAPHIGSATSQCRAAMVGCALQNVTAYFEARELLTQVNL
jgi:lactate dehydrogenase-like 2-hydroxyacid dehydrogenase